MKRYRFIEFPPKESPNGEWVRWEDVEKDNLNASFARITELIGEMSWGIDLPSPMECVFQEFGKEPQKIYAVDPKNYEKVFDAIYTKLQSCKDYDPYRKKDKENLELISAILRIEKIIEKDFLKNDEIVSEIKEIIKTLFIYKHASQTDNASEYIYVCDNCFDPDSEEITITVFPSPCDKCKNKTATHKILNKK